MPVHKTVLSHFIKGSTMAVPDFKVLADSYRGFAGRIIGLDPGETTGYAVLDSFTLMKTGQLDTKDVPRAYDSLSDLFDQWVVPPTTRVAAEDYRIYSWKAQSHSWSEVHTIKVVGIIQLLAHAFNIPHELRTAQIAKAFITDSKLRDWGFYREGEKHARDAIRHAAYDCLFGEYGVQ